MRNLSRRADLLTISGLSLHVRHLRHQALPDLVRIHLVQANNVKWEAC